MVGTRRALGGPLRVQFVVAEMTAYTDETVQFLSFSLSLLSLLVSIRLFSQRLLFSSLTFCG